MNENTDQEIVRIKLDKLLNKNHCFYICDLEALGKLLGVNTQLSPDYTRLNALHCVHYVEMSEELKQEIPVMVMNCLTQSYDSNAITQALFAVKNSEVKGLPQTEDDCPTRLLKRIK